MTEQQLFIDNNNVVALYGLQNSLTGESDAGANVSVTIVDGEGGNLGGQIWPLAMAYDANEQAYIGTLEHTLELTKGEKYRGLLTAIGSAGERGAWELPLVGVSRVT